MMFLFVIAVAFVFYTYLGYPLLLLVRRCKAHPSPVPAPEKLPRLSLLIPVYNEEAVVEEKILNTLNLQYPGDKLEIVVVSDGSRDRTNQIVARYCSRGVTFIRNPNHRGKMSVINQVVPSLKGKHVVITDASAIFALDALQFLAARLEEPAIGAVSGELVLKEEEVADGPVEIGWYWRLEKFIRKREGDCSSSVGVTGAIYALRRELFKPLPEDTVLDDLLIPLEVIRRGYRVVFENRAKAYERKCTDIALEFRRKVRTLVGNYQAFSRSSWAFRPGRSPVVFALISHKLFRLLVPGALILLLLASAAGPGPLKLVFLAQVVFYLLGGIGLVLTRRGSKTGKVFSLPLTFCLLNAAALWAFIVYFFKKDLPVWK